MPVKRLDTDQPLGSKKPKYKKVELSNEQRFEIVTYHLNNKHLKNIELCQHFSELFGLEIKRQRMSDWLKPDQIAKIIKQNESEQEVLELEMHNTLNWKNVWLCGTNRTVMFRCLMK